MTMEAIIQLIQKALPKLRQKYGVRDLWLFGSYVRGEQQQKSDLDVLVEFDNPHLSLIEFIQLELELSELLEVKVDLVEKATLKPTIGQRILHEAIAV
jgi:predicted nucleotidyltransferase